MAAFIVDLILLIILSIGLIVGYKRGFIKSISVPVRRILAFVIAFGSAGAFGSLVISPFISEPITENIRAIIYENCPDIAASTALSELPLILRIAASLSGVDLSALSNGQDCVAETVISALAGPIIGLISTVLSFIILLIVSLLVIKFLFFLLDSYSREGIIGAINKIAGSAVNLLLAVAVDWILVSVFAFIINSQLMSSVEWASSFYGGFIYRFFDDFNPLELILRL